MHAIDRSLQGPRGFTFRGEDDVDLDEQTRRLRQAIARRRMATTWAIRYPVPVASAAMLWLTQDIVGDAHAAEDVTRRVSPN